MYFLDIGHPCYDQYWHLSKQGICWPASCDHIAGSSLQLIKVKCFFEVDRWPSAGFSIGSWAHVWFPCWKQGRIVRKPVNANPGLKPQYNFIFYTNVFAALFCVYGDFWNSKQKAKQYTENLSAKLQNSNQNSTFSWVSLIGLWTTLPRSYAFRLA